MLEQADETIGASREDAVRVFGRVAALCSLVGLLCAAPVVARVEKIAVHGKSLEGNL